MAKTLQPIILLALLVYCDNINRTAAAAAALENSTISLFRKMDEALMYTMGEDEYFKLGSLGVSWRSDSRTECVRKCINWMEGEQCGAVEFDELSRNCSAGFMIIKSVDMSSPSSSSSSPSPSSASSPAVLYSKTPLVCDETLGFRFETRSNDSSCLFISREKVTRDIAADECKQVSAQLYSIKSMAKYEMLDTATLGGLARKYWVGLKDTSDGGTKTFSWEDGQSFHNSSVLWGSFWKASHPGIVPAETCVAAEGGLQTPLELVDDACDERKNYVCEMILV